MRVEAALVQQTVLERKSALHSEAHAWARLFDKKYFERTLVGIMVMFFQRKYPSIIDFLTRLTTIP